MFKKKKKKEEKKGTICSVYLILHYKKAQFEMTYLTVCKNLFF